MNKPLTTFAAITAFAVTVGMGVNLTSPETIPGSPQRESASYFIPTNGAPAIPTKPMPLPTWAADFPTSPNGAPIVHHNAFEVYYSDGVVLWQAKNGDIYWDMHPYTYST